MSLADMLKSLKSEDQTGNQDVSRLIMFDGAL